MTDEPTWILRVLVEGRWLRYATAAIDVDDVSYRGGLELEEVTQGTRQIDLALYDPSEDWPTFGPLLDGQPAELDMYDGARVRSVLRGTVVGVEWGAATDTLALAVLARDRADSLLVLDTLARVDVDTWPVTGGYSLGEQGRPYPLVFGTPGNVDGTVNNAIPVVPVPLCERDANTARVIVCEDGPNSAITSVRIRNVQTNTEATVAVDDMGDLLLRSVRYAFLDAASPLAPVVGDQVAYYAGYAPGGGSGVTGSCTVYDAISYLLQRRGAVAEVDWNRWTDAAEYLATFRVDTWLDDPSTDPWSWVRSILSQIPGVELRSGDSGTYISVTRYVADLRRIVGSLSVDVGEITELAPLTLDNSSRANEFIGRYRADREGVWLERIILTGSEGVTSAALIASPTTADVRIVTPRCTRAQARYGPVTAPVVDIDWTWDRATMVRILEAYAERDAYPAILTSYRCHDPSCRDIVEGDQLRITDTARGLRARIAIVAAPPTLSHATVDLDLRIPRI